MRVEVLLACFLVVGVGFCLFLNVVDGIPSASTSLGDTLTPSSSCFISCLKVEISDVRFPKCSCIWLSKRESLSIIWLKCSRLRASDCLLSSITVLLERQFLLGNGVCCEDERDDLFSRSFLLDVRGCRVYRQILASILAKRFGSKLGG